MDLVSFENQQEQNFVGQNMARAGVREVWTSGRLCDKERWWWDFLDQDQKCFGDHYLERQKPYFFSIYWYQIHHSKYVKCQKGSKYPFLWVLFTKNVATFGNSTSKMDPILFLKTSSLTLWLGSGWMWPTQVPTFQHQWMVLGSHFSHHGTNKRVHWKKIQCLVTNWPSGKISAWWYSEEWWIWSASMCCSPW